MTSPQNFNLFVYGSLRSGFKSPAYDYITRYFDFVSDGKVRGYLYDLGEYPAALPTTDDAFIVGELYVARDRGQFDYVIAQLDDYEGVTPEPGETALYNRILSEIETEKGTVSAWVYWYNGNITDRPIVESGDIMEYLKNK
ncbi:MAG: gamma-glutamylcyclotransferase [Chitinophagaceae bacterium]|nr:gamma-glutamylcyclotransferase [Chitinophagaceae bacterium]